MDDGDDFDAINPAEIRTAEDTIRQFDAALAWLDGLGVSRADWMTAARKAIPVFREVRSMAPEAIVGRHREIVSALFQRQEAADLIRIHQEFGRPEDADIVRKKFNHGGATSSSILTEKGDGGLRNFIAELSFAAMVRHAGFETDHSFETDFFWKIPAVVGRRELIYAIEVKRPEESKHARALRRNVKKGAEQVEKAVRRDPKYNRDCPYDVEGGLVVIIVDRLLLRQNLRDPFFLIAKPPKWAKAYVGNLMQNFGNDHEEVLDSAKDCTDLFGVRLLWRSMVRVRRGPNGTGLWTDFHQQHLHDYRDQYNANRNEYLARWLPLFEALRKVLAWTPRT